MRCWLSGTESGGSSGELVVECGAGAQPVAFVTARWGTVRGDRGVVPDAATVVGTDRSTLPIDSEEP